MWRKDNATLGHRSRANMRSLTSQGKTAHCAVLRIPCSPYAVAKIILNNNRLPQRAVQNAHFTATILLVIDAIDLTVTIAIPSHCSLRPSPLRAGAWRNLGATIVALRADFSTTARNDNGSDGQGYWRHFTAAYVPLFHTRGTAYLTATKGCKRYNHDDNNQGQECPESNARSGAARRRQPRVFGGHCRDRRQTTNDPSSALA